MRDRNDPLLFPKLTYPIRVAGQLEEALEYYKRSKDNGVDRAAMHIRNVCNIFWIRFDILIAIADFLGQRKDSRKKNTSC